MRKAWSPLSWGRRGSPGITHHPTLPPRNTVLWGNASSQRGRTGSSSGEGQALCRQSPASPSLSPSLYICYGAETRSGPQRSTALTLQDPPSPQAAPLLRGLFHPQNPAAAFSGGRVFPPPPHPQAQVGGRGSSLPHPPHIAWSSGGQAPRHARSPCDSQALSQLLSLDSSSSSKDRKNSDFIPLSPMRKLRLRQMAEAFLEEQGPNLPTPWAQFWGNSRSAPGHLLSGLGQ